MNNASHTSALCHDHLESTKALIVLAHSLLSIPNKTARCTIIPDGLDEVRCGASVARQQVASATGRRSHTHTRAAPAKWHSVSKAHRPRRLGGSAADG